jgi:methionyl-tRNA formyltransferase
MTRTVVFAYHEVGCRGLSVLLDQGIEVALVVTHPDDPMESRWYGSVRELARREHLPCIEPEREALPGLEADLSALEPDFLFSFYYRHLLPGPLVRTGRQGALNLHGSLLPRYRGRAPVNWAILRGERETGASLHFMTERADAGALVDQMAVPILMTDQALEVSRKVAFAAELVLARSLGPLVAGQVIPRPLPLLREEYYGRRRPEDGRIDWRRPALEIHNLIRAVAPPFPGAFTDCGSVRLWIDRARPDPVPARHPRPTLYREGSAIFADCGDGGRIEVLEYRWHPPDADSPPDLQKPVALGSPREENPHSRG